MSIQGKAIIELTDVNTGEVEVVEENNLVTNGVKLFYERGLSHILPIESINMMRNGKSQPAVYDLFGGIAIFAEALTEDPDNYDYPSCDTVATACVGRTNVSAAKLGSYNSSESGKLENGYKFVYDFSTSQANGEIGSVCLTPLMAATMTYGQNSNEYVGWGVSNLSLGLDNRYVHGNNNGVTTCNDSRYTLLSGVYADMHLFFDDTYMYTVKLHNLIYNNSNANSHISKTKELVIEKRLINGSMVDVFDYPGGMRKRDETITIPLDGSFGANIDYACQYVDGYLYLYALVAKNNGESLTIRVIDTTNWSCVESKTIYNETGKTWAANDGYRYVRRMMLPKRKMFFETTDNFWVLVDIDTGIHTFVTVNSNGTKFSYSSGNLVTPKFTNSVLMLNTGAGSSRTLYVVNIETAKGYKLYTTNEYFYQGQVGNYVNCYKKGVPHLCLEYSLQVNNEDKSRMMFIPYILMTINNLSSKVIKTTDKTMKITYILYDDTVTT